jgi:hypothetical protein
MPRVVFLGTTVLAALLVGCPAEEPKREAARAPAAASAEKSAEARIAEKSGPRKPAATDGEPAAARRADEGKMGRALTNGDKAPAVSPALAADQERMRRRDAYVTGLGKSDYTFNAPSPIKVARPITVALWVDPTKVAAELVEEMKKAYPESAARVVAGETIWSPRMKARLTGPEFEITPLEGEDFDGVKDLSLAGRTEWRWNVVPTFPGKKKLTVLLWAVLPPELGVPREVPAINRDVEVEVTVWWLVDHYWEKYWRWMIAGLASALAAAIGWWWKKRHGAGA